jgi:hypothetical protein
VTGVDVGYFPYLASQPWAAGGVLAHFALFVPIPTSSSASGTQIATQSICVGVLARCGPRVSCSFAAVVALSAMDLADHAQRELHAVPGVFGQAMRSPDRTCLLADNESRAQAETDRGTPNQFPRRAKPRPPSAS